MQVKTVSYTEVMGGVFVLGFKSMDKDMAEMMNNGWRVQSQSHQSKGPGILPGSKSQVR